MIDKASVISKNPTLFWKLVEQSGWTEKDGPFPGVFNDRPEGHHCLWSCIWHTEDGTIHPEEYAPPIADNYELADLAARGKSDILSRARLRYPEYAAPWGGRYQYLVTVQLRPGWPRPTWAPMPPPPIMDVYHPG